MWTHVLNLRNKAAAWFMAGMGTFAALAIASALGVFEAMPERPEPHFKANDTIDAGQWRIKPTGVRVAQEKFLGVSPKEGQKAVVLETELTNLTARSTKDYYGVFHLPSDIEAQAEKPMVYLARDMTIMPDLHPGMTEKMIYVWLLPDKTVPADGLAISVRGKTYKARDNLTGSPGWYNEHTAAIFTLPVTMRAAQR